MSDSDKEAIIPIIIGTISIIIVVIFMFIDANRQRKEFLVEWNNGYHVTDNGKWVMEQAIGHGRDDNSYIYRCSKCNAWIELSTGQFYWIKDMKGKKGEK